MKLKPRLQPTVLIVSGLMLATAAGAWHLSDRIVPHTFVGVIPVGGLQHQQAADRVEVAFEQLQKKGITLDIDGTAHTISPDFVGFDIDSDQAADVAFARGRGDSRVGNILDQTAALVSAKHIDAPIQLDRAALATQVAQIAAVVDQPRQDVRLVIKGESVSLATDTKAGRVIDQPRTVELVAAALAALDTRPITVALKDDAPVANAALAPQALADAKKMLSHPLTLTYQDFQFVVNKKKMASWIVSTYDGPQLKVGLDRDAIAQYVIRVAKYLDVPTAPLKVAVQDGRVIGLTPPTMGQTVDQPTLVNMIVSTLMSRLTVDTQIQTLLIPLKTTAPSLSSLNSISGVKELIGKAVTTFTGSPNNRISNIKNGVHFLSGSLIEPGQEFSTLATLGEINETTGYLPELVIKGDRTQPEFGGGLCQVSTTLFRAVMNAALPITMRQNHSYRVSYYEKDGNGIKIGPGLDATVYQPNPDFRFRNDTATPVLIVGYVIGDKVTFELYGTKDGRSSHIDGPHLLSEVPSGDAVYIETPTLPAGQKKRVETPHPGGSAIATYTIKYADGHADTRVFKSKYRPWPEKFLVGTNTGCSTSAQCAQLFPQLFATPFPTPTPAR